MADNNESSNIENTATESLMLNEPQANSTPIVNNRMEENDIIKMMKLLFNEQSIKFDTKLDNFNEKLNQFDVQFSDIKKEIKKQGCNLDKRLSEIGTKLDKIESENEKIINKFELNKDNKVSSSGNDDKINKNIVIGDNSGDVGSDNEVLWGIEYNNNGMIVCFEGLKRVCEERYIEREKCCWASYDEIYFNRERCFKSERYCAVSYTHLDVYKRQVKESV